MSVQPINPQDRRPSMKKQTAGSKSRKQAAMDAEAVGFRLDGVDYVINPNDLTGRLEFEIRSECGMGVAEIAEAMGRTGGIDFLGMFMWACKKSRGENVELLDVLDSVNAGSDVEILEGDELAEALGSAPKASDSAS